ncbi:MAG: archaemetzincin family Zn-dependent metalloprotease [Deltaproteobacteria bacterium]|nr:archaemetzincin family Zn-dependent metalloprotease [Deltaproteobacteria bacterium]
MRPVGMLPDAMLRKLRDHLRDYLSLPVRVTRNMPVPEGSYERNRNQYNSTRILREILTETPADAIKIVGIIDKDLCIPILTFVFGEAQLGGMASIVSIARLRQEFHGLSPNEGILFERLVKEALHELGHNFGLIHCNDRECIMYLSNTVRDVDRKKTTYCGSCDTALYLKSETWRI